MQRYSKVYDKMPREVLLLKSLPCLYGKCSFCNYILDNSTSIDEIRSTNYVLIDQLTGEFGAIEVLNSGSVFEIPEEILIAIRSKVDILKIEIIYFEVYYGYMKRLQEIHDFFPNQKIRFRIGIETFDDEFRAAIYNKPFPTNDITNLAHRFYACCLLICVVGQTQEQICTDINLAIAHFRAITINVFVDNGTQVKRDPQLVKWFINTIYPAIKDNPKIEILVDNKDLGVYVQ